MSTNMTLIETKTVGAGGAADIEFTSIPSTYTDLVIQISARSAKTGGSAWDGIYLRFNGSTTNYDDRSLAGTGSSAISYTDTGTPNRIYLGDINMADNTASTFGSVSVYIPNYAGSNNKSVSSDAVQENNATAALATLNAGVWSDSAAITSIKLFFISNNFVQYSTASLYGISNVTSTTKATGGIVSSDGTYNYHMFPYSGTFTPTQAISADVLVIAGGGGGGYGGNGGGGGAGGVVYKTSASLTASAYTVTVGGGGASTNPTFGAGNNGGNSVFDTITANGGGGGGAASFGAAQVGGSGGGAAGDSGTGAAANQGNSGGGTGYGNAGAAGFKSGGQSGSGGGGGAGAAAVAPTTINGGNGGAGLSTWSSWANATQTGVNGFYAGGGAGSNGGGGGIDGTGGAGGGGSKSRGIANTGGGGGGENNGGSGLVIIRYAI